MHPRALAFTLIATLLAASAATAFVVLSPPRASLAQAASDVDHVTLYQNGLAFIRMTRSFESAGGETLLEIPFPQGARIDSVQIAGANVTVRDVRTSGVGGASLLPGDTLVVHVEGGTLHRGTYVGEQDASLVLSVTDGTILVEKGEIAAIEIVGRTTEGPGRTMLFARVEAPAGSRSVDVSYLAQGPGWEPSYLLDAVTGAFQFHATLRALDDWRNVTLDLMSGSPNVILVPEGAAFKAALSVQADAPDQFGASTPLGALHRYRYERPLEVSRGETVRLLVKAGHVDLLRDKHVVEAATGFGIPFGETFPVEVKQRVEFRNSFGEPLAEGRLLAYRDGTWVGEDTLRPTPRGERANVTLASSIDVTATLVLVNTTSEARRDVHTYALHVENGKEEHIDLHASLSYPTYRTTLLEVEPAPSATTGGRITWDQAVPPGGEATFRIRYETIRE